MMLVSWLLSRILVVLLRMRMTGWGTSPVRCWPMVWRRRGRLTGRGNLQGWPPLGRAVRLVGLRTPGTGTVIPPVLTFLVRAG